VTEMLKNYKLSTGIGFGLNPFSKLFFQNSIFLKCAKCWNTEW